VQWVGGASKAKKKNVGVSVFNSNIDNNKINI
jgi:hypothetical protein